MFEIGQMSKIVIYWLISKYLLIKGLLQKGQNKKYCVAKGTYLKKVLTTRLICSIIYSEEKWRKGELWHGQQDKQVFWGHTQLYLEARPIVFATINCKTSFCVAYSNTRQSVVFWRTLFHKRTVILL